MQIKSVRLDHDLIVLYLRSYDPVPSLALYLKLAAIPVDVKHMHEDAAVSAVDTLCRMIIAGAFSEQYEVALRTEG